MTDDVRKSLDRIGTSLARIDTITRGHNAAGIRLAQLRTLTEAALAELDAVIARVEAGAQH